MPNMRERERERVKRMQPIHPKRLILERTNPFMSIEEEVDAEKRSKNEIKEKAGKNGVIISIYVESQTIRSHHKNDPIKPNPPFPSKPRRRGYDRRAQLLAYAQELRHPNCNQEEWSQKNSRPKTKKWRWSPSPARFQLPFRRWFHPVKGQWRYERVVTDEQCGRKTKTTGRSYFHFCRRLRCILKELSCACHCNKGS